MTLNATLRSNISETLPFTKPSWIATQTFLAVSDVLLIYVFVRLFVSRNKHSASAATAESRTSFSKKTGATMHTICMVVASTDILHAIAVEVYLIWAWDSVKLCQTIVSLCIATYATSVLLTFTFLWLRQRILYANRLLQHLSNHATQALSWISIVGISAAILASALPHTVWTKYELSNMECILVKGQQGAFQNWLIVYMTAYSLGMLLLLGLYIHPLIRHRSLSAEERAQERSGNAITLASEAKRQARFYACVVRSVVLTAVCIAGDIVDAVAASVISGQNTERWTILVAHQMHIVLNLMCMVFCFVHWRDILLPHSARNLHLAVETS